MNRSHHSFKGGHVFIGVAVSYFGISAKISKDGLTEILQNLLMVTDTVSNSVAFPGRHPAGGVSASPLQQCLAFPVLQ